MSSTLKVHHLQVSQSDRIVWLCEELGIPYELVLHQRAPLFSPDSIKDLNPLGQAPVIQDQRPDGSILTLAESAACAEYIINVHGNGRLALPPSHPDYAQYLYWFHFANGGLQPVIGRTMVLKMSGADESGSYAKSVHNRVTLALQLMDKRLKDNQWLAGSNFTAADIMSVFSLTTMRTFVPFSLKGYDNILAYLKRCSEREGFKRAREKGDPDLELMIGPDPPRAFVDVLREQGKL